MNNIIEYLKASFFVLVGEFKNDFHNNVTHRIDNPNYYDDYGDKIWDWLWAFSFFSSLIPGMITYLLSVTIWFSFSQTLLIELIQFVVISAAYSLGWMLAFAIVFRVGLFGYSLKRKADNMAKKKEQING